MKIKLKTLKQNIFEVDLPAEDSSVLELKQIIENKHSFEVTSIKLLFNGLVLDDKEKVSFYNIKEGSTLILMTSKIQKKNDEKKEQTSNINNKQDAKEEKVVEKVTNSNSNDESKEKENTNTNNNNKTNSDYASQLEQLLEMGFEEQLCKNALNASKGSVPIAIEYLYTGIPQNLGGDANQEGADNQDIEIDDLYSNEEEKEDDNDHEHHHVHEQNPQYLSSDMFEGIDLQNPNALPSIVSVIKVIISEDPSALSDLLAEVEESSPEIIDFIRENDVQFKSLMSAPISEQDYEVYQNLVGVNIQNGHQNLGHVIDNEEGEDDEGDNIDPFDIITQNFTDKDRECISNLISLGFDRGDAIQAYIACDKNETNAANFLFQDKNN